MPLNYEELQREIANRRARSQRGPENPAGPPPTDSASTRTGGRPPRPPRRPVELIGAVITAALSAAGLAMLVFAKPWEPVESFPYRLGLGVGIVIAALYAVSLLRVLRRWGEPDTIVAAFVAPIAIFVCAAVGFGAVATVLLSVANAQLDGAKPSMHRVTILDKSLVGGTTGERTRVTVPFWKDHGVRLDLQLGTDQYDRIHPHRTQLVVTTRPGRLGWEWIDGPPAVAEPASATSSAASVDAGATTSPARTMTFAGEPRTGRQFLERGLQRLREGQPEPAAADFAQAIELEPTLRDAYEGQAESLAPARDYEGIVRVWTKYLAVRPDDAAAWVSRANARLARHDLAGAQTDAEQACQLGDQSICPLAERLRARAGTGR